MATNEDGSSTQPSRTSSKRPSKSSKHTAKKSSGSAGSQSRPSSARGSAPRAAAPKKKSGLAVAAEAARQLLALTGRDAEGVTSMERTESGWTVNVEVVEVRRIPETTDILAVYEVTVDDDGDLESYRRLRRYSRGEPREESG